MTDPAEALRRAARVLAVACRLLDQGQVSRVRRGLERLSIELIDAADDVELAAELLDAAPDLLDALAALLPPVELPDDDPHMALAATEQELLAALAATDAGRAP